MTNGLYPRLSIPPQAGSLLHGQSLFSSDRAGSVLIGAGARGCRLLVDGFLEATASRSPDDPALVCGASRLTFAELECGVGRVAAGLARLGVRRGDRVIMHLENNVDAVMAVYGSLRAGAVIVPVNPTIKSEKLAYVLRDCEPTVLISSERASPVLSMRWAGWPSALVSYSVGPYPNHCSSRRSRDLSRSTTC